MTIERSFMSDDKAEKRQQKKHHRRHDDGREAEEEEEEQVEEEEDHSNMPFAIATPLNSVPSVAFDPQRWTDLETVYLVACYKDKWYQLKRRHLQACHWEEVANSVFLKCGGGQPSKSSVQCRHKMEKLRKRYREEKQLEQHQEGYVSAWPFFMRMDAMETGVQNDHHRSKKPQIKKVTHSSSGGTKPFSNNFGKLCSGPKAEEIKLSPYSGMDDQDPPDDDLSASPREEESPPRFRASMRNLYSYHNSPPSKKARYLLPKDHNSSSLPKVTSQPPMAELASVLRSLGEGFLRIEQLKLEVERDIEQLRLETELKRTQMLIDSQKDVAEMITHILTGKRAIKKRSIEDI